jgi:hypothetical protein
VSDEFLTQELPAIRRAQERSLVAFTSAIRLIDWGLWKCWKPKDLRPAIVCPTAEVGLLRSGKGRRSTTSTRQTSLNLATFAVCLDAIESIAEARGSLSLPGAERVRAEAVTLRTRMMSDLKAVTTKLKHTESRAYGIDDPLTAAWLLPIVRNEAWAVRRAGEFGVRLGSIDLLENVRAGIERLLSPADFMIEGNARSNTAEEHSWPASLAVRALNLATNGAPEKALAGKDGKGGRRAAEALRVWSEQQVRLQLARSVTGEGGQDAAHLAAALALAMWLEELPLTLLEAAVEQLCTMQRSDGSLVLTRPYLVDEDGSAITPLAADVTLAMIAVADQLGVRYPEHPTVLRIERQVLEAVQRQRDAYFRSSVREASAGPAGEETMLWWSDRARPSPGRCDTWATARTVTALVMILNLESRLITRRLLEESQFSYRRARELEKGFDDLVDPQLKTPSDGPRTAGARSPANSEPAPTVVSTLKKGLCDPDPDPKREKIRAVLLCGPPGTSKTSLVEAVAKQLDADLAGRQLGRYPVYLVQLSPADFLLDGPNRTEQRAKRIFDYLTQMENVVVLFDEIDRLILDRADTAYAKQADVFQFMTPSMLPKLTALRQRGSVIRFAIATNYGERIDPAIARKGRIDRTFVIAPPNLNARAEVLKHLPRAGELAAVTPLWVYGDLKSLGKHDRPESVMRRPPTWTLRSYAPRQEAAQTQFLADEILQLAELYREGDCHKVLKARGEEEEAAIIWACDNASGAMRSSATKMRAWLKKQK